MHSKLICIEGVIGAGKTSLARMLARDMNANLVLERFEENSFLSRFYNDRDRYAFSLEMSFLADRYHQIQMFEQLNAEKITISDYYITKSKVFASINLSGDEVELFNTVYDIMFQKVLKPKLLVYLYRPVEQLIKNVQSRGRAYEISVEPEYLKILQTKYLEFLESRTDELAVLILDLGERDFVQHPERYQSILKTVGKQRLKGLYRETV